MPYEIIQEFIAGVPDVPFRFGKGEGVVNHCTDNPVRGGGDTPTGEHNYEARTFNDAWVHFFVGVENGQAKIIQNSSLASGCYGAGMTANSRYWQIELCMYDDPNLFKIAYDAYVWLTTKLLYDAKLGVTDRATLWSHADISNTFKETDHQDPVAYLASHGISWTQHVNNVIGAYQNLQRAALQQTAPNKDFLLKVIVSSLYYYNKPDWNAKAGIVHQNEVFTVVDTLTVNGSKMYKLKSGNYITANPSYVQVM